MPQFQKGQDGSPAAGSRNRARIMVQTLLDGGAAEKMRQTCRPEAVKTWVASICLFLRLLCPCSGSAGTRLLSTHSNR
jgi:hypothetical protein